MKILLVLSNYPFPQGEAIEIVSHEILRLMVDGGYQFDVQVIIREQESHANPVREDWARERWRQSQAVNFLPTIYLGDKLERKAWLRRKLGFIWEVLWTLPLLRRRVSEFLFPATKLLDEMRSVVDRTHPDAIMGVWSWEALAATYAIDGVAKFMYYGNPDHKPEEVRLQNPKLFGMPNATIADKLRFWTFIRFNRARRIQHLRMMSRCDMTVNNSLEDANFYAQCGHPNSRYLQNLWPVAGDPPSSITNDIDTDPPRVVASVGNLGATGNTFGLHFLGDRVAPALSERHGGTTIRLDIYGGGKPSADVARVLDHPSIHRHGWVDDLDSEIRTACAFLVLTNVSGFVVGNTRILLAWSLGSPLVAHTVSALSMPEIVHGENALLGETAEEITDAIVSLASDSSLRSRIGRGGYETFRKYYDSEIVVPKMAALVRECREGWAARWR